MSFAALAKSLPDEAAGFSFRIDDEGCYVFEAWSPAGEDLPIEGTCKSPETALNEIKAEIAQVYKCFDIDEHVDLWAPGRGDRGVPSTYQELVEDATAIDGMLEELSAAVCAWTM